MYFIQRNQAASSPAMEYLSFKQCMEYLMGFDLLITTFVSDHHTTIAKHIEAGLEEYHSLLRPLAYQKKSN
jgi:hypothetical protein